MQNKNKNKKKILLPWLIAGIALIIFSIMVLIYTFTNKFCQIGPAICNNKKIGAYIGIFLGIVAIIFSFHNYYNLPKRKNKKTNYHWLTFFGIELIIIGIIMAPFGFDKKLLNPSGAAVSPGFALIGMATLIALAGIIIAMIGACITKSTKNNGKDSHPIVISLFAIGTIVMIYFFL